MLHRVISRPFLLLSAITGGAVIAGIGLSLADEDPRAVEEAWMRATMTAVVEQAPERRAKIDNEFLLKFNSGQRDYTKLVHSHFEVAFAPALSLSSLVERSEIVVVAVLQGGMQFYTSGDADLPVGKWTVRIDRVIKGDFQSGQSLSFEVPGGPVDHSRRGIPDAFLTFEFHSLPRPGDRLVLSLAKQSPDLPLGFTHPLNIYQIRNGRVVDDEVARMAGIAGVSEDELVAQLTAAANSSR